MMISAYTHALILVVGLQKSSGFTTPLPSMGRCEPMSQCQRPSRVLFAEGSDEPVDVDVDKIEFESEEAKKEAVGNLVADDEWAGLSMELSEVVRIAVLEDLKKTAREFTGKCKISNVGHGMANGKLLMDELGKSRHKYKAPYKSHRL